MNANQILQQRKLERIKKQRIHESQLKRKYSQKKKYLEEELKQKLQTDIMGEKKVQFYETIFNEADQNQLKYQVDNQQKVENLDKTSKQQQKQKHTKSRKEKKEIKQIFTQKNKKGQPVLKNYLNILVKKIEKDKQQGKK